MRLDQRGFTLVEIMVAVAVAAVLLSTIYGVFEAVAGAKQRLDQEGENYHVARVIFDRLSRELRGVYAPTTNPRSRFEGGTNEQGETYLRFTTTASTPLSGAGIGEVSYLLQQDQDNPAGRKVLERSEQGLTSAAQSVQGYRIAGGIDTLTLRFFDQGAWSEQWPAANPVKLPQAVEISLQMEVGDTLVPFRTTFDLQQVLGPP
ncbi:MAG: type II secretion system protein GspJ [Trichloromonadaceae bacterium]